MIIARAPQVGVNDENVLLIEWLKQDGHPVKKGEVVAVVETTKAVSEIEAEGDGFLRPVAKPGDRVAVNGLLYVLTDTADESIAEVVADQIKAVAPRKEDEGTERRWTQKAKLLADKYGVKIEDIPAVGLLREADVEKFVKSRTSARGAEDLIDGVYQTNRAERVLILGGGRGAVQVLDVICNTPRQRPVGIVDDNAGATGKMIMGVRVLGTTRIVPDLLRDGVFDAAVIAFSNNLQARASLFDDLVQQGVPFTNVIDPSVRFHLNVAMGKGNVIIANSRIGACATIGDNNFLSAFVNIEHHNVLRSHCTFGPGVLTSSRVTIGDRCRFGTGVFIEPGVTIGEESIIASGAIITGDVPPRSILKVRVETAIRPR